MTGEGAALRILPRTLGGPPIARDGRIADAARAFYAAPPVSSGEWRDHVHGVRAAAPPAWNDRLAAAFEARGAAAERLQRVASGQGIVVTTGQQPGLFGGPLYTWWKALSALALADVLEQHTGVPVAPVFWAATDDADFAEASETFVAVSGGLDRLVLDAPAETGARLADVPLDGIGPLLGQLRSAAGSAVYPEALDVAADAYRDGATIGGAYVALLRALLEPLGIAVLDAAHGAVRAAGAPLLVSALRQSQALEQSLVRREAELQSAGFRPQVPLVRGRTLVFSARDGARERIAIAAATREAGVPDDTRGPNVLLRPVMERAILPTAAYVAGPGEMAYFAQTSAVAETLGAAPPLAVPRWSGTIVEPHVQRLLDRYALDPGALQHTGAAEAIVARASLAPALREAIGRLRGASERAIAGVTEALRDAGAPHVAPEVLTGTARDLDRRIGRLERRIVAAAKREQTEAIRDVATLRAALAPNGKPQERVLNLLPLLARYGPGLFAAVRTAACAHAEQVVLGTSPRQAARIAAPDEAARERIR